jgi:hypothetical protein
MDMNSAPREDGSGVFRRSFTPVFPYHDNQRSGRHCVLSTIIELNLGIQRVIGVCVDEDTPTASHLEAWNGPLDGLMMGVEDQEKAIIRLGFALRR